MRPGLVALALAAVSYCAFAQQYRWVDEKGRVHYTDTPPPASAKSMQKKRLHDNAIGTQPSYDLAQAVKNAPVTLYTHPDCQDPCQRARELLQRRGVPFSEVSAIEPEKIEQLNRLVGGPARVPLLRVGAQVEKEVSAEGYDAALDRAGYPRPTTPSRARP